MHRFKQIDLLPYIYGEVSNEQSNAIRTALETDLELREQYQELLDAQKCLETISLSPRKNAVDFIMNYANASAKAAYSTES
jgi:hypothetical protein